VSECEETRVRHAMRETFPKERVFVIQHLDQSVFADIPFATPIDRVAEFHVVRRHRFRYRSRSSTYLEKVGGDFLTGTNFGERAVNRFGQVYLKRFFLRRELSEFFHDLRNLGDQFEIYAIKPKIVPIL